jgi:hypothetical protein
MGVQISAVASQDVHQQELGGKLRRGDVPLEEHLETRLEGGAKLHERKVRRIA